MADRPDHPAQSLPVYTLDADWPTSCRRSGLGFSLDPPQAFVGLRFESAVQDSRAPWLTIYSATAGNSLTEETLEVVLERSVYRGPVPEAPLPSGEQMVAPADGTEVVLELWRQDSAWVARGCIGSAELVLNGFGIEPSSLRLRSVRGMPFFKSVGLRRSLGPLIPGP